MHRFFYLLILLLTMTVGAQPVNAQQPFTPGDNLDIASLRNTVISPNGKYVAAIRNYGSRNRLNVDHFQFGNPNYIRPFSGMLVLYDLEENEKRELLEQESHVIGPSWSEDSRQLAFWIYEDNQFMLRIWDMATSQIISPELQLPAGHSIASVSPLVWLPEGGKLLISLRKPGWAEKGEALFREATEGPVIEYDASEPFLKWGRTASAKHSGMLP